MDTCFPEATAPLFLPLISALSSVHVPFHAENLYFACRSLEMILKLWYKG